jgi:Flp pilus assembly pilin Flp
MRRSEKGQTSSEYAIVLGLIAPPIIILFVALSDAIVARIDAVAAFFTP